MRYLRGCRATENGLRLSEEEGLCYICSDNKGTDQLRCYSTADLRLCFGILKNRFSNVRAQIISTAHRRA